MIAAVGTVEVAAYHIAINVEGLGYMPAYGFSAAATTLVGQKLGAKAPDEAARLGRRCIHLSLALLTAVLILLQGAGAVAESTAAADNTEALIAELNLKLNHARQSAITTEISEIEGGTAGMQS